MVWYDINHGVQHNSLRDILLTITKRCCMTSHIFYGILKKFMWYKCKTNMIVIDILFILYTLLMDYILIAIKILYLKLSRDNKIKYISWI